jgi:hypothetical protein
MIKQRADARYCDSTCRLRAHRGNRWAPPAWPPACQGWPNSCFKRVSGPSGLALLQLRDLKRIKCPISWASGWAPKPAPKHPRIGPVLAQSGTRESCPTSGNPNALCTVHFLKREDDGARAMQSVTELRFRAKQCLELANTTNELDAKTALRELARKLSRDAHQAERRERDMGAYSNLQASSRRAG